MIKPENMGLHVICIQAYNEPGYSFCSRTNVFFEDVSPELSICESIELEIDVVSKSLQI